MNNKIKIASKPPLPTVNKHLENLRRFNKWENSNLVVVVNQMIQLQVLKLEFKEVLLLISISKERLKSLQIPIFSHLDLNLQMRNQDYQQDNMLNLNKKLMEKQCYTVIHQYQLMKRMGSVNYWLKSIIRLKSFQKVEE